MQFHIESKHVEREFVSRSGRDSDAHGELTDENNGRSGPSEASHPQHPSPNTHTPQHHRASSTRTRLRLESLHRSALKKSPCMVETTPRRPPETFENTDDFTDEVHAEIHDDTYAETFADIHAEIRDSGFVLDAASQPVSQAITATQADVQQGIDDRSKVEC